MDGTVAANLSNLPRQIMIVICGDLLPHHKIVTSSSLSIPKLTVVRVPEEEAWTLCKQIDPSVLVARQALILQAPSNDFALLTNRGGRARVIAVVDSGSTET